MGREKPTGGMRARVEMAGHGAELMCKVIPKRGNVIHGNGEKRREEGPGEEPRISRMGGDLVGRGWWTGAEVWPPPVAGGMGLVGRGLAKDGGRIPPLPGLVRRAGPGSAAIPNRVAARHARARHKPT